MEYYNYIKSLHLILVITWFAGLFYIPRLFIYHIEANSKPSPVKEILTEQLKLMASYLKLFQLILMLVNQLKLAEILTTQVML